jgi:U6 snRNA-associated Sm-like protein LSm4
MPECYIRGNSIKYLRIPDEVIDLVVEEEQKDRKLVNLLFIIVFNKLHF